MEKRENTRLGYCDVLRCLAALAVVLLHCSGSLLWRYEPASPAFFALDLLNSASRWAVPMFLMLSGMFLLDPERPMSAKKWLGHLGRVALSILLWGFLYAFWDARAARWDLEWFLEALILMVKGELHYHLWYLPMLLGLYLLLPPMRALVQGSSRQGLWYLVGLWAVAALGLGALYTLYPQGLGQAWLELLGLYSLSSCMGYFLLGYLLKTCRPTPRQEGACYVLGLLGLAVTCLGTRQLSLAAGCLDERLYGVLTPNICLMAVALFLAARRLELGKGPLWAKLSGATFGVYLIHPLLIELGSRFGFPAPGWSVVWAVPLQTAAVAAAALAVSCALRRVPKIGKYLC